MNLLVDTHVLIWLLNRSPQINQRQIDMVTSEDNDIFLSAVSIFEITTKLRIGKLKIPERYRANVALVYSDYSYIALPLQVSHADLAGRLPNEHKDPFDRLLAAQAIIEDMAIMTIDTRIGDLGAKVVW